MLCAILPFRDLRILMIAILSNTLDHSNITAICEFGSDICSFCVSCCLVRVLIFGSKVEHEIFGKRKCVK